MPVNVLRLARFGITQDGTYYHFDVTETHIYITTTTAGGMTVQKMPRAHLSAMTLLRER